MNWPSSTPLPVATSGGQEPTPTQVLQFIQSLLDSGPLASDPSVHLAPNHAMTSQYIDFVASLSDDFVGNFPRKASGIGGARLKAAIDLSTLSLEVVERVIIRVEGLFSQDGRNLHGMLMSRLLVCINRLDDWLDDGSDMPRLKNLRDRVFQVIMVMFQTLGGDLMLGSERNQAAWAAARTCFLECLGALRDLLPPAPTPTFPVKMMLFHTPRVLMTKSDLPAPSDPVPAFILNSVVRTAFHCLNLLQVLVKALYLPLQSETFLSDIFKETTEVTCQVFDFFLAGLPFPSAQSIATSDRVRVLQRFLEEVRPLLSSPRFDSAKRLEPYFRRLLVLRLKEGPKTDFHALDVSIAAIFDTWPNDLQLADDAILKILYSETWGEDGLNLRTAIYAYLRRNLQWMNVPSLVLLQNELITKGSCRGLNSLQEAVQARISLLDQQAAKPDIPTSLRKRKRGDDDLWRNTIKDDIQTSMLSGSRIGWFREIEDISDVEWSGQVLRKVEEFFAISPVGSPEQWIRSAQALERLPCKLTHHEMGNCQVQTRALSPLIPIYTSITIRVLDGRSEEVPAEARRYIYNSLARACRHHPFCISDAHEAYVQNMLRIIHVGMGRPERAVRLSAGHSLAEYIRNQQERAGSLAVDALSRILEPLLRQGRDSVKETTIVSLGLIGKVARDGVLQWIVCTLMSQLGQQASILKAVAYQQLQAISKYQKKPPYNLIAPYMAQIALSVVSVYHTKPSLLAETCHFISVSPADFLSLTLPSTLPQLVADCNFDALSVVAHELGKSVASMSMTHAPDVFECIYMLEEDAATDKALDFILNIVKEATAKMGDPQIIGVSNLVHGHVVPLLARLTIGLGDENMRRVELAEAALQKVARTSAIAVRGSKKPRPLDLCAFLKPHLLGIIAYMNDVLQDVHGKKQPPVKRQVIRSMGRLIDKVGPSISIVSPQVMATFQSMVNVEGLMDATLSSWYTFITTLSFSDIGPYIGLTTASFVTCWPIFSAGSRDLAEKIIDYLALQDENVIGEYLGDIVALESIPALRSAKDRIDTLRQSWSTSKQLDKLLERSTNDNPTVAARALTELKEFMVDRHGSLLIQKFASGDIFDPTIGRIVKVLFAAACRDGETCEVVRLLAFECIGVLGAVDPDRFDISPENTTMTMLSNFNDEEESIAFVLHLIQDLLLGVFRSTGDMRFQGQLAYVIQELASFCGFTPALVIPGSTASIPAKTKKRWASLPKHVIETLAPLLDAKFLFGHKDEPSISQPIYPSASSYRLWVQRWSADLISRTSGDQARKVFSPFRAVLASEDVAVIRHILPHLVLNILVSGTEEDRQVTRTEIITVLSDQVEPIAGHPADRRLLSAQTVFLLMDHLSKWIRMIRLDMSRKRQESKRSRIPVNLIAQEHLVRVESMISSIDRDLMAQAAFQCKQYARALTNFEQQVIIRQERGVSETNLQPYYERLHEIYAHLDEPDGMAGISTKVLSPSLEHQIREHESTGRWTSAQSCWEVSLQHCPDKLEFHLGLLRCLRNLGHYDTLRTHIRGVLGRNPSWEQELAGFSAEGAWMVGDWQGVEDLVQNTNSGAPEITVARLLLAMRTQDENAISETMATTRFQLGSHITAAGPHSYRRCYEAVIDLHRIRELEMICELSTTVQQSAGPINQCTALNQILAFRLNSTLPTFRAREPVLSMRRVGFGLSLATQPLIHGEIGRAWLASSKIARKAGHTQTAYSAMLQARQSETPYFFIQGCKLVKAGGEAIRALQELDNALQWTKSSNVIDLTDEGESSAESRMRAKGFVLQARWMAETDRYAYNDVSVQFSEAIKIYGDWESVYVHWGHFIDQSLSRLPLIERSGIRGIGYTSQVVKNYAKALIYGSKYIYQTMPRMLTLWMNLADNKDLVDVDSKKGVALMDPLKYLQQTVLELNREVEKTCSKFPVYKWLTAFPQIVSRVGHSHRHVWKVLTRIIYLVIREYPQQGLWMFAGVVNSTRNKDRERRVASLLDLIKGKASHDSVSRYIDQSLELTTELLKMCNFHVKDETELSLSQHFPTLAKLAPSSLILPLQDSFTMIVPPHSSHNDQHKPFPDNLPTIHKFVDEIEIMKSLQKPRKFGIRASDGETYYFLCKPKDDLRKDARLMDLNAVINKLLKKNSESRRRQLHIRTYSVIPLNEECGLIEWVRNTLAFRQIMNKYWEPRSIALFPKIVLDTFERLKTASPEAAADAFADKILPLYPLVFREWFLETFPEPTAWLASRLAYGRTAAVMSMVGYILGLGDRHCENIMFDSITGDTVHCDFNCLFEKGKAFDIPEVVPFRLSRNIVDALGVTGVEGVFRIACEATMQLLRDNKDCLMSVLEAFVHDPLVEWEDEKKRKERHRTHQSIDLRQLAQNSLDPIERKIKGIEGDRQVSVSNQVEALIRDATDLRRLSKMYQGWCAFC